MACVHAQLPGTHAVGATAVSWAPAVAPGALVASKAPPPPVKRLVSCGCDNIIRVRLGRPHRGALRCVQRRSARCTAACAKQCTKRTAKPNCQEVYKSPGARNATPISSIAGAGVGIRHLSGRQRQTYYPVD